jgi:hypothetical protein
LRDDILLESEDEELRGFRDCVRIRRFEPENVPEKSDRAASRANRPSFQLRSFCLVIHFTDSFDHGLRLVKLDVFRTIAGEDLFSVGR